jgi:hypothetical protein
MGFIVTYRSPKHRAGLEVDNTLLSRKRRAAAGAKPGRYRVWLKAAGPKAAFEIDVSAGGVVRARL